MTRTVPIRWETHSWLALHRVLIGFVSLSWVSPTTPSQREPVRVLHRSVVLTQRLDVLTDRRRVHRNRHPKRPPEGSSPLCDSDALWGRMQPSASPWSAPDRIRSDRDRGNPVGDRKWIGGHAEQLSDRLATPAADAGADGHRGI